MRARSRSVLLAAAAALCLVGALVGVTPALAAAAHTTRTPTGVDVIGHAAAAASAPHAAPSPQPPVASGHLRIAGMMQDGATVTATGLRWRPGRLPAGDRLMSFEVAYLWDTCGRAARSCGPGADTTITPFAARHYVVGHGDDGRRVQLTEAATEVVQTSSTAFTDVYVSAHRTLLATAAVVPYPSGRAPWTAFLNGTPEATTGSRSELFKVDAPHFARRDGVPVMHYRVDRGPWLPLGRGRVFGTGELALGPHRVLVRTANRAGATTISFAWRIVRLASPIACEPRTDQACWYPPHLDARGRPMRWDWQIGAAAPIERTGASAVDIYDVDGFLTSAAQVRAMHTTWQAATLAHPKAVCYLDAAWEDYRPDASPVGYGGLFPPSTLGRIYFGYPNERWVDFRQLDALKPMLESRIAMCARKGFDAVELDDIEVLDSPAQTGFELTTGDVQNFLAFTFNLIHRDGMTALWKNTPNLTWWGRHFTDGAIVEECYEYRECFASQLAGQRANGITCTVLSGPTPCGWDDFTTDVSAQQPTGKWVGEAEYVQSHFVCRPGASCAPGKRPFNAYCRVVYQRPTGFAGVLFSVDLNAKVFDPCPRGV